MPAEGKSDATTRAPASQPAPSTETPAAPTTVTLPDGSQVDQAELVKGYLRQGDYTKKTQAVAREREDLAVAAQLAQALDLNPAETLKALAEAYEVDLGRANPDDDQEEELPPKVAERLKQMEAELAESRSYRETAEERELQQLVDKQLAEVQQQAGALGVEYDEEALLEFALDNNLNDLHAAWLKMHAGKLLPSSTDLKRRLPGSRSGALAPRTPPQQPQGRMDVRQALEAAMAQHEVSSLDDLDDLPM